MGLLHHGLHIPTAFASCSITNRNGHTLFDKMSCIRQEGYDGMEISMPDILAFGKSLTGETISEDDIDTVVLVAEQINRHANDPGLTIIMLQPFSKFEGWDEVRRDKAFTRAAGWVRIMEALGTDMLQVGSSDARGISSSIDVLAADLAQLADMLAEKGFKVAYENWCWATSAPTWAQTWEIVKKANHSNLGLCLDTFQIAGSRFADPTTTSGWIETLSSKELDIAWMNELAQLMASIPPEKIFLLQISDAYKMSPPIKGYDKQNQHPKAQWSHSHRPLPFSGGYLPVQEIFNAVFSTGFRGWLSVEVFDPEKEKNSLMEDYVAAGLVGLHKLVAATHEVKLNV